MPGKNVANWGAQSVRSTMFTTAFDVTRVDELYHKAFGQQPSNYQGAPVGFPTAPSQASGVDNHGQLQLQKSPGRLDLIVSPSDPPRLGTTPQLKDHISALDFVQDAASRLASDQEKISRIALVAEYGTSTTDVVDANKLIDEIIPYTIPLDHELDFVLQLTKRYNSSAMKDLQVNFLFRWAVTQMLQYTIPQFQSGGTPLQSGANFYLAQFVMDVNTVPETQIIAGKSVGTILKEMREKIDAVRRGQPMG